MISFKGLLIVDGLTRGGLRIVMHHVGITCDLSTRISWLDLTA